MYELVTEVVFKHLRLVCDRHASPHLLAFFSRILFEPQFAHGSDSGSLSKDDHVIDVIVKKAIKDIKGAN